MTNRNLPRNNELCHLWDAYYKWKYSSWSKEDLEETKQYQKPAMWENL